jgi:hypothetical protein
MSPPFVEFTQDGRIATITVEPSGPNHPSVTACSNGCQTGGHPGVYRWNCRPNRPGPRLVRQHAARGAVTLCYRLKCAKISKETLPHRLLFQAGALQFAVH